MEKEEILLKEKEVKMIISILSRYYFLKEIRQLIRFLLNKLPLHKGKGGEIE